MLFRFGSIERIAVSLEVIQCFSCEIKAFENNVYTNINFACNILKIYWECLVIKRLYLT